MANHPYAELADRSFWRKAVGSVHYENMMDLWDPPEMRGDEKFATAGSCFAQHIGRHVRARSFDNYMQLELPPPSLPQKEYNRFGYDMYTCRYGNIYTCRQLLQIAEEAIGERPQSEHVWDLDGRFFDAIRPSVDPVGLSSEDQVHESRSVHLRKVRKMLESLDVMIFTLGLTEAWVSEVDGTTFPSAPGVIAGNFRHGGVRFQNFGVKESLKDLEGFWGILRGLNPTARMILTVSPVPLIATASGQHVLPATMYSKSVLRAVAQEMANAHDGIHYFPSYEIINSPQGRGYYFDPDLRSVNDRGVRYVMSHFFTGDLARVFPEPLSPRVERDVVCDEEAIEESDG